MRCSARRRAADMASVDSGFNDFDTWFHRELEVLFVNCRICHLEKAVWQHERPDESVQSDTAHLVWIIANHRHGEIVDGWDEEE
jgi:hypothetical protein